MILVITSIGLGVLSGMVMIGCIIARCIICIRALRNRQILLVNSELVTSEESEESEESSEVVKVTLGLASDEDSD